MLEEVINMETQPKQTDTRNSGAFVGAALLIVIGVGALVANLGGGRTGEDAIPLAIGVAFMVAYALTRRYGYLVAGGILSGIGSGILTASLLGVTDSGPYAVIGGGLGFLLIYGLDLLSSGPRAHWWPVIPGSLMILIGGGLATDNEGFIRQVGIWSPLLLVALGVWILVTRGRMVPR
jgi:hypothetical protein